MSIDGFAVDPTGLGSVAPQYAELAFQLDQSRAFLKSTLDSLGNYWGDDEAGAEYARTHVPGRDAALQYHADIVKGVQQTGEGISGWSGGYGSAESSLVEGL
jgi:hypothetical protein